MATPQMQRPPEQMQNFNSRQGPPASFGPSPLHASPIGPGYSQGPGMNQGLNNRPGSNQGPNLNQGPGVSQGPTLSQGPGLNQGPGITQGPRSAVVQQYPVQQHERSFSQGPPIQPIQQNIGSVGRNGPGHYNSASISSSGPPQLSTLPFQNSSPLSTPFSQASTIPQQAPQLVKQNNALPVKPVFGMTLERLFERDSSPVPILVYQCIQAVDLYGLEVEGIYRLSGTASHVNKLKAMFDNGK
jgi:Rho GTPase-activating protein RGD1